MAMEKVAIVGTGLIGCTVAQVFAAAGKKTTLYDIERGRNPLRVIERNIELMIKNGAATEDDRERTLGNLEVCGSLEDAVGEADLVVENVDEDLPLKQQVFAEAERYCRSNTVLATDTSALSPTELSKKLHHRERFIGMHFWNPAHLIPLVELVKTDATEEAVVQACRETLLEAGKRPVVCEKDVPGFIGSRLQHALWREAISIVEQGIADAQTVDETVKYGLGLRLPVLGPLENADMIGLDLTLRVQNYLFAYLEDSHAPSGLLRKKVEQGKLGFKAQGNGFYCHTPEEMEQKKKKLQEYLIRIQESD